VNNTACGRYSKVLQYLVLQKEPVLLPNNLDLKSNSTAFSTNLLSSFYTKTSSTPHRLQKHTNHNKTTTMSSPQVPNTLQNEADRAWQDLVPRIDNLIISLTQRRGPREVISPARQEAEAEATAIMEEMRTEMDRLLNLMAEQLAILEAKIKEKEARRKEKADMIAFEESIVGFLQERSSIPDIEEK
jgi:hypothetical protein